MKEKKSQEVREEKASKKAHKNQDKPEKKRKRDVNDTEGDRPLKKYATAPSQEDNAVQTSFAPQGEAEGSDPPKKKKKKERTEATKSASLDKGDHQLSPSLEMFMNSRMKKEPKPEQHNADNTKGDHPSKKGSVVSSQNKEAQTSSVPMDRTKSSDDPPKRKKKKERPEATGSSRDPEAQTSAALQGETGPSDPPSKKKKKKERPESGMLNGDGETQSSSALQVKSEPSDPPKKKKEKKDKGRSATVVSDQDGDVQLPSAPQDEDAISDRAKPKKKSKKDRSDAEAPNRDGKALDSSAPEVKSEASDRPQKKKKTKLPDAKESNQDGEAQRSSTPQVILEANDKPRKRKQEKHSDVAKSNEDGEVQNSSIPKAAAETGDQPRKRKKKEPSDAADSMASSNANTTLKKNVAASRQAEEAQTPFLQGGTETNDPPQKKKKKRKEGTKATDTTGVGDANPPVEKNTTASKGAERPQTYSAPQINTETTKTEDRPRKRKKKEDAEGAAIKASHNTDLSAASNQTGILQKFPAQKGEPEESDRPKKKRKKKEQAEARELASSQNADQSADRKLAPPLQKLHESRAGSSSPQPSLLKTSSQGKEKQAKSQKRIAESFNNDKQAQAPVAAESTGSLSGNRELPASLQSFMNSMFTKEPKKTQKGSSQQTKASKKSKQGKKQQVEDQQPNSAPADRGDGSDSQMRSTMTDVEISQGMSVNSQLNDSAHTRQAHVKTSDLPKISNAAKSNVSTQGSQLKTDDQRTSNKKTASTKKSKQPKEPKIKSEEFVSMTLDNEDAEDSQLPHSQKASLYDSNTPAGETLDDPDSLSQNEHQAIAKSKRTDRPQKSKEKTKAPKKLKNKSQEPSTDTPDLASSQNGDQQKRASETDPKNPVKSKKKIASSSLEGSDAGLMSSKLKPGPSTQTSGTDSTQPVKSKNKKAVSSTSKKSDANQMKSTTKPEQSGPRTVLHSVQPTKGKEKAAPSNSDDSDESDDGLMDSITKPELSRSKSVKRLDQPKKIEKRTATPSSDESDASSNESTAKHKSANSTKVPRPAQPEIEDKKTSSPLSEESDDSSTDSSDHANDKASVNISKTNAGKKTVKKETDNRDQTPKVVLPFDETQLPEERQDQRKQGPSISSNESSDAMSNVQPTNEKDSEPVKPPLQQGSSPYVSSTESPDATSATTPPPEKVMPQQQKSVSPTTNETTDAMSDIQTSKDKDEISPEEVHSQRKRSLTASSVISSDEVSPVANDAPASNESRDQPPQKPQIKREDSVLASLNESFDGSSDESSDESDNEIEAAQKLTKTIELPSQRNSAKRERSHSTGSTNSSNTAEKDRPSTEKRKVSVGSETSSTASASASDSDSDQSEPNVKFKSSHDKKQEAVLPLVKTKPALEKSSPTALDGASDAMEDVEMQDKGSGATIDLRKSSTASTTAGNFNNDDSEPNENHTISSDADQSSESADEEDPDDEHVPNHNKAGSQFPSEIKPSVIENIGEWGPVLAYTPGLSVQTDQVFNAYSRRRDQPAHGAQKSPWSRELALHNDSHQTLDFTAREESEAGAGSDLQHCIGIYHPESGEMELIPTRRMVVRSTLKSTRQPTEKAEDERENLTSLEKKQALNEAFGTKKSQKQVRSLQENAIVSTVKSAMDAQGKPIFDASVSAIIDSMDRPTAFSRKQMQAETDANKPVPKPNLDAKRPQDVYTAEGLISERALRLVGIHEWQEAIEKKQSIQTPSRFVSNRVKRVVMSGDSTKIKMLKYLHLLISWKRDLIPNKRGGGYKLSPKPKDDALKDNDGLVRDAIKSKFAPEAQVTAWGSDNLNTHLCALALLIDNLETDICDIREDINVEMVQAKKYYLELGASVKPLQKAEIERLRLTKATASSKHMMARLKLPLVFPPPPRKRAAR